MQAAVRLQLRTLFDHHTDPVWTSGPCVLGLTHTFIVHQQNALCSTALYAE